MAHFSKTPHLLLLLSLPIAATSQGERRVRLAPATWTSAESFTHVSSVRELRDGSVLVVDPSESSLWHISADGVRSTSLGRRGDGPGEYRALRDVFALPNDSTLLVDAYSKRLSVLSGARFVHTTAPLDTRGEVRGANAAGQVLLVQNLPDPNPRPGVSASNETADSLRLILRARASDQASVAGTIRRRGGAGYSTRPPSGAQPAMIIASRPLALEDQAILGPDGWLTVARADPYRVEFRAPDGQWTRGPNLPFVRTALDADERCFAYKRVFHPSFRCSTGDEPGWPAFIPAVTPRSISVPAPPMLVHSSGVVLVMRTVTSRSATQRYDVIDRQGRLVAVLELPIGEYVAGVGRDAIYSTFADEDGLRRLRRHGWTETLATVRN